MNAVSIDFEQLEFFERWLPVVGWEGLYEVSDWGRVRSLARNLRDGRPGYHVWPGRMLVLIKNSNGYIYVTLSKENRPKQRYVHQLVATAFIGPCPLLKEVDHIDGDRHHNHIKNLRYVTKSENKKHSWNRGGPQNRKLNVKLTKAQLREIRRLTLEGMTQRQIAEIFGVCQATIGKVLGDKIAKERLE